MVPVILVGRRYTHSLEGELLVPFECVHCGYESAARLKAQASGTASTLELGMGGTDHAQAAAKRRAEEALEDHLQALARVGKCPCCGNRDAEALAAARSTTRLKALAPFAVLALLLLIGFGLTAQALWMIGGVVFLALIVERRAQWRWNNLDEEIQVFSETELKAIRWEKRRIEPVESAPLSAQSTSAPERDGPDEPCPACGEPNPIQFDFCWKCEQALREEPVPSSEPLPAPTPPPAEPLPALSAAVLADVLTHVVRARADALVRDPEVARRIRITVDEGETVWVGDAAGSVSGTAVRAYLPAVIAVSQGSAEGTHERPSTEQLVERLSSALPSPGSLGMELDSAA